MREVVVSMPNWLARIIGFIIGFFLCNEALSIIKRLIYNMQTGIPSIFQIIAQYNENVAVIVFILMSIAIISLISKFRILTLAFYFMLGIIFALALPYLYPIITKIIERIKERAFSIVFEL